MRTTISIDDELLSRAKVLAAEGHRSLGSVLEDALREMLARDEREAPVAELDLPAFGDPADAPLVDILNKEALATALDEDRLG